MILTHMSLADTVYVAGIVGGHYIWWCKQNKVDSSLSENQAPIS